jgi:hypothetical protein
VAAEWRRVSASCGGCCKLFVENPLGSTVQQALRDQLGLKLESAKGSGLDPHDRHVKRPAAAKTRGSRTPEMGGRNLVSSFIPMKRKQRGYPGVFGGAKTFRFRPPFGQKTEETSAFPATFSAFRAFGRGLPAQARTQPFSAPGCIVFRIEEGVRSEPDSRGQNGTPTAAPSKGSTTRRSSARKRNR